MIPDLVSEVFARIGHLWKVEGGWIIPGEEDVAEVLTEATKVLYDGDTGDRLEVGGIIIEKVSDGHDVYVFVGNIE